MELSRRSEDLVLIGFWAAWCQQCQEVPAILDDLAQRYAARGVAVFAVALDDPADTDIRAWRQEHWQSPLSFLVSDVGGADDAFLGFGIADRALPLFRVRDRRDCSGQEVTPGSDWRAAVVELLEHRLDVESPDHSVAVCEGWADRPAAPHSNPTPR